MGVVLTVPGLLLGAVVAKSVQVQVIEHERIVAETEDQQHGVTKRHGRRGAVYDRDGVVLAHSAPVRSVWADPSLLEDPVAVAKQLGETLDIAPRDRRSLARRLLRRHRRFEWVVRHVRPDAAKAVGALRLPGIGLREEHKRYWPHKELAGQVLGFTDLDGHGLSGLERTWEQELSGRAQVLEGYRDARRRLILGEDAADADIAGRSLHLTLNAQVQHWLEAELEAAVHQHSARGGVALVLDAANGDLLGLANAPRFNPNAPQRDADWQRNRAITDAVEVGSVVKPFTVATALSTGAARIGSTFDVTGGRYRVGGYTIKDTSRRHKRITLAKCLEVSSNVCLAQLAERIGRQRLAEGLRAFGFAETTGSGLAGEAAGRLSRADRWSSSRLATVAYGYGFSATLLQVATAMAAVANGGLLVRPRLVTRVVDAAGRTVREYPVQVRRRAVSEEVAKKVAGALLQVVEGEDATAPLARAESYSVAGKTGTARKIDRVLGEYVDRFRSTFVGFAPATAPRVVVLVSLDEPKPDYYAGKVAAPAFSRLVERILLHLEVPLDRAPPPVAATLPKEEDGGPTQHAPAGPALAVRRSGLPLVPDFSGMTLRRALVVAAQQGLVLEARGGGRAVGQSPRPGTAAQDGATCRVEFTSSL